MMTSRNTTGKTSRARRRAWASPRWSRSVAGCASALAMLWRSSSNAVTGSWAQWCCSQVSQVQRTRVRSPGRLSPHEHCQSMSRPAWRLPARHLPRPGHAASASEPRGQRHGDAVRPHLQTVCVWLVQAPACLSQPAPGAARSRGDDAVPPWGGGRQPWPAHAASRSLVPAHPRGPSEPARGDVRKVPHPLLRCTPSRLPLPWHHHRCAPRLACTWVS